MSSRSGCLGSLFAIPARLLNLGKGRRALSAAPDQQAGLAVHPKEAAAVKRADAAADRCMAALHSQDSVSGIVLDEVGGAVQGLRDQVHAIADRLAAARSWLGAHDPESIRAALVELELSGGGSLALETENRAQAEAMKAQLRHIEAVHAAIPSLAARLQTTARQLEGLEARFTAPRFDVAAGADGLIAETAKRRRAAEESLAAWRRTIAEIDGL